MSNLKEYVVVRRKTGALELQQTIFYNHWHKGNPDYIPVATFNSNEDLEQGEIETLKAENSKMRQALEEVSKHCKAAGVPKFKEDWVLIEIDKIATEALKTP